MNNSEMSMIESVASGSSLPDVGKEVFFRDIGLKVGDRLIVEGLQKARPDAEVTAVERDATAPAPVAN